MLDRAITVYARNFVPFFCIVAVVTIPMLPLQHFLDTQYRTLPIEAFKHAGAIQSFTTVAVANFLIATVGLVVAVTVWPFAINAVSYGVAEAYLGEPVTFAICYRASLRRWKATLTAVALQARIVLWYWSIGIAPMVVFGVAFWALSATRMAAGVSGAIGGLLFLALILVTAYFAIVLFFWIGPFIVGLNFGMNAVVIENSPPAEAVRTGLRRATKDGEFWRTFLFALAYIAAEIAFGLVASSALGLLHSPVFADFALQLINAAAAPFWAVLLAVYYFDVRIRREGLDLETQLAALTATTPA
jgi:hypothetical protein